MGFVTGSAKRTKPLILPARPGRSGTAVEGIAPTCFTVMDVETGYICRPGAPRALRTAQQVWGARMIAQWRAVPTVTHPPSLAKPLARFKFPGRSRLPCQCCQVNSHRASETAGPAHWHGHRGFERQAAPSAGHISS